MNTLIHVVSANFLCPSIVVAAWIALPDTVGAYGIFGCCGLRAAVQLEIVQHHGEILLGSFFPS